MTGVLVGVVGGVDFLPQPEANAVIAVAMAMTFSVVLKFVFMKDPLEILIR
jgi:hypothetical protein